MDAEQFKVLLLSNPLAEVVEQHLLSGVPYVFRRRPKDEERLREHLAGKLGVPPESFTVVGSAKTGFSLSPDRFPRPFSSSSDIDVVCVSERLFDQAWETLLRWHYPRRHRLENRDWQWAKSRMVDVYWGWLAPTRINYDGVTLPTPLAPLRALSRLWFDAFQSLSRYPEFSSRKVTGRLYRDRAHVILYHEDGLRQILESFERGALKA